MPLSPEDERLIEKVIEMVPKMHEPKCPACGHQPLEFACNLVKTVAGHIVAVMWCGRCGHALGVQFVGIDQPKIQSPLIVPRPA